MPLYFFDIHDDETISVDDDGSELSNIDEARREAKRLLPTLASEELPEDGDRRVFTVIVRDCDGQALYSASLAYAGLSLTRSR